MAAAGRSSRAGHHRQHRRILIGAFVIFAIGMFYFYTRAPGPNVAGNRIGIDKLLHVERQQTPQRQLKLGERAHPFAAFRFGRTSSFLAGSAFFAEALALLVEPSTLRRNASIRLTTLAGRAVSFGTPTFAGIQVSRLAFVLGPTMIADSKVRPIAAEDFSRRGARSPDDVRF
jgi:hypothetical protein